MDSLQSNGGVLTSVLFDELITEILSRLPVKTLMQFKCVCKSWNTLISHDSSFTKLHLHRSRCNTHLALLSDQDISDTKWDFSVVPIPVSRLLEIPLRNISIPKDPSYFLFTNMDCCFIVGSCNGLICLNGDSSPTKPLNHWLRFWNPATKTLSEKLGYPTNFFKFITFGYDILNDTYKVVAFSANKVNVFSMSDNVWRDIPTFPIVPFGVESKHLECHPFLNCGVYVRGTINWLAIRNMTDQYEWRDITIDQFVIISLDLATETYRQLLPPSGFVEVPPIQPFVTVLLDCLCFSHYFKGTHFVLWKMMEFGVQESWTQFLEISFQDLQIDYGSSDWEGFEEQLFLLPLCVSESNDTLIMACKQEGYDFDQQHAVLYNWRDKRVKHIESDKNIIWWFYTKEYVESLVSTS